MVIGNPKAAHTQPVIDLVLHPYRSLGRGGFRLLMGAVIAINLAGAIGFMSIGAWPVLPFFGLDIWAVWYAFRVNNRDARATEQVCIDYDSLTLRHIGASGRTSEARFPTMWVRIVSEHTDHGVVHLFAEYRGQRREIGARLPPPERPELGRILTQALATAKRGPVFEH